MSQIPHLFGLSQSNRDFTKADTWGKNQFNSSFPAALCNYMESKGYLVNYVCLYQSKHTVKEISIRDIYKISSVDPTLFFAFESQYSPYAHKLIGSLPRTDLVLQKEGICLNALEVKLTALPDHTTCHLSDENYGCELVVRPDTIIYLACSLATHFNAEIKAKFTDFGILDWSEPQQVLTHISMMMKTIKEVLILLEDKQNPFLLQPIWKTKGKKAELADFCLDVFVWSDIAFSAFVLEIADGNPTAKNINRQTRTVIWLYKMLQEIARDGRCHAEAIIDKLAYNNKNDKAFASSGRITNPFMRCERLTKPLIHKTEIKNIILGGGQNLLSPERRFDAIIVNSPHLFEMV